MDLNHCVIDIGLEWKNTLVAESVLAGFARREVGHQFTESASNGALIDFEIVRLVARVVHRRTVGNCQSSSITSGVVSVRDARQLTRRYSKEQSAFVPSKQSHQH